MIVTKFNILVTYSKRCRKSVRHRSVLQNPSHICNTWKFKVSINYHKPTVLYQFLSFYSCVKVVFKYTEQLSGLKLIENDTLLHIACRQGYIEIVKYLLGQSPADPNVW